MLFMLFRFIHCQEAKDRFAQCGFACPSTVNPSDFFIDVIVGMYDDRMKFRTPEGM